MITGSMVALVTPMHANGGLDWDALAALIEWHIEQGTHAIVAMGTTGESATLSFEEHIAVVRSAVNQVRGRIPVIAGTGANSTSEAIELTRAAKEAKVDACLLVTPYYNKPTQEGLYLHHKAVAEAVAIPQILYNVPGRTVCDMLPDTTMRLAQIPNIRGIKDATGNLERARELIERAPSDFYVYSGDDETAVELILLGGKGDISVTANVAPRQVAKMNTLALAGKAEEARALNGELMGLHKAMFVESNPIPVKWALEQMGKIPTGIRLPLTTLSIQHHETVRAALTAAGLL
ncbi:MAG TPA: 4-hydroxy-tetrahydrodipicolinate synthase [Pseudomonadales bacterium]|jgi:4-hydroxy-tetrahydrodipicolinate synthase|nr:4-hydroxy-tetrahydrodipicolinate synthase [Pseudomonadales bacterium]